MDSWLVHRSCRSITCARSVTSISFELRVCELLGPETEGECHTFGLFCVRRLARPPNWINTHSTTEWHNYTEGVQGIRWSFCGFVGGQTKKPTALNLTVYEGAKETRTRWPTSTGGDIKLKGQIIWKPPTGFMVVLVAPKEFSSGALKGRVVNEKGTRVANKKNLINRFVKFNMFWGNPQE